MKVFGASIGTVMLRFYLMMIMVIVGVYLKLYFLALLALPVFLTCLLGLTFKDRKKRIN